MRNKSTSSIITKIRRKDFSEWMTAFASIGYRLKSRLYYPLIFGSFGAKSFISRPIAITKPQHINVGNHVTIRPGVRLEVIVLHPEKLPELRIGNNVNIEQNVHIVCHHRILIGDNVSITANCSIVDTTHPYDDLPHETKVGGGIADDDGFVEIGSGTFVGIGCVILPYVRIGKGCVIGAHSVVTRDVPDYSVAVGAPARVIRSIRKTPSANSTPLSE